MTHAHTTLEKHPICETSIDFEPGAARNFVKKMVRNRKPPIYLLLVLFLSITDLQSSRLGQRPQRLHKPLNTSIDAPADRRVYRHTAMAHGRRSARA